MKLKIEDTLPWKMSNVESILGDKSYAVGCIVSEKIGGVIVALSYNGGTEEENIGKVKTAGEFIVKCVNASKGSDNE